MFCPECGKDLIAPNQKFCHNCGAEIVTASKTSESKSERFRNEPSPQIYYVPVKPQTTLQKGVPGKYSYMSFWFALVSISIGIATFYMGINFGFPYMYMYIDSYYNLRLRLVAFFVILFLRAGGLILGIYSRMSDSKAVKLEPYNDMEKAGSIIGIFGIIINTIGLIFSIIVPITLLRPIPEYY